MSLIDDINKLFSDGSVDKALDSVSDTFSNLLAAGIEAAQSFGQTMGKVKQGAHERTVSNMKANDGLHRMIMRKTADQNADLFDFFDPDGKMLYRVSGRFGVFKRTLQIYDHNGDQIGLVQKKTSFGQPVVYQVWMYGESFGEIRTLRDRKNFLYDAYGLSIESVKIGFTYSICNNLHKVIATISSKDLRKGYFAVTYNDFVEQLVIVTLTATVCAARKAN